MLQAGLLLGRVNVDSLVLFVDLVHDFAASVSSRQVLVVESVLLLVMFNHLSSISQKF